MRRLCVAIALIGAAAFAATSLGAPGAQFAEGVAAGEITPTSAILWTRAPNAGRLVLGVSSNRKIHVTETSVAGPGLRVFPLGARAADDRTVRVPVGGLTARDALLVRVRTGCREKRGRHVRHGAARGR